MGEKNFGDRVDFAINYSIRKGLELRQGNSWRCSIDKDGHIFWIYPIDVRKDSERHLLVNIHLSHKLTYKSDNQIYFDAIIDSNGSILDKNMSIDTGGFFSNFGSFIDAIFSEITGISLPVSIIGSKIETLIDGSWQGIAKYILSLMLFKLANPKYYIFDPDFYLGLYADLLAAFNNDHKAAADHWVRYGIDEGRQGARVLNPKNYLKRYGDLINAFGATNYEAAINAN